MLYNHIYSAEEECIAKFKCLSSEGILEVTADSCQYKFWLTMHLPCRHIMAVRDKRKDQLFSEELVAPRWTLTYIKTAYDRKGQVGDSLTECFEVCHIHSYNHLL